MMDKDEVRRFLIKEGDARRNKTICLKKIHIAGLGGYRKLVDEG
jgi:hypothetical protein